MSDWTVRLQERMDELGFNQTELAQKINKTRSLIALYLSGDRTPPLKVFNKLAYVLECDPAWLQFGETSKKPDISRPLEVSQLKGIPLIPWNKVHNLIIKTKTKDKKSEFVPCFCHQTEKSRLFALKVKGDSMHVPRGTIRSFHEGDILVVDPDKELVDGSFVVVIPPNTQEATFKQYILDGGIRYLKPLNPQYPVQKVDKGIKICGIVVACLRTL